MKRFFLVIILTFTTGLISSCSKDNNQKTASVTSQTDVMGDKFDMGSGD